MIFKHLCSGHTSNIKAFVQGYTSYVEAFVLILKALRFPRIMSPAGADEGQDVWAESQLPRKIVNLIFQCHFMGPGDAAGHARRPMFGTGPPRI